MCPEKRFKQMFLIAFGNTDAIILNGDNKMSKCNFGIKLNERILARIFDRITNEVDNAVFKKRLIKRNQTCRARVLIDNVLV
jgi:hypothetical protein